MSKRRQFDLKSSWNDDKCKSNSKPVDLALIDMHTKRKSIWQPENALLLLLHFFFFYLSVGGAGTKRGEVAMG